MTKFFLFISSVVCFTSIDGIAQTTLILQPNPAAGKDALISSYSSYADSNFASANEIPALAWTSNSVPYIERSLFKFNLSSIPANSTVMSAYLSLYAVDAGDPIGQHSTLSGPNNAWIERVTSAWDESTITWNNQPSTTIQDRVGLPASSNSSQDYIADVSQLTQDILSSAGNNFGFMLLLDNESFYRRLNFFSSDYSNASKRPKLVITYCSPPSASISLSGPANVCQGDSVTLTTNSGTGYSYQWNKNGTDISGATSISYAATTSGLYSVNVTNSLGCTANSTAVNIIVGNQLTIVLQPDGSAGKDAFIDSYSTYTNTNFGNDINLLATAWTSGSVPYLIRSFIEFNLLSIPSNSIITSAHLSLYGNGLHSIYSGPNDGWIQKVTASWDESTITWTSQPSTTTQNRVALPASISVSQDYLNMDVTDLIRDMFSGSNFGMMINLADENYYRQLNFCSSDYSDFSRRPQLIIVCEIPDTAIVTPAGSTSFCSGSSVKLNANTGSGYSYQWIKDGMTISGANSSDYYATLSGNYSVQITTACSIVTSASVSVTVNPLPSATITANGQTTFCAGASVVLNAPVAANRTYQWIKNGVNIPGATSSSYNVTTGGSYKVTVININTGCIKTTAIGTVVTVNSVPSATITPQGPTSFCAGGSVLLQANTGTALTYQWKKDGTNIPGATISNYAATTAGVYKVRITNGNGCTKLSAGITVTVPCREGEIISSTGFNVSVFPNPANSEINIVLSTTDNFEIEILSTIGESIIREHNKSKIDISNLANGVYFIKVFRENNFIIQKFIKQ